MIHNRLIDLQLFLSKSGSEMTTLRPHIPCLTEPTLWAQVKYLAVHASTMCWIVLDFWRHSTMELTSKQVTKTMKKSKIHHFYEHLSSLWCRIEALALSPQWLRFPGPESDPCQSGHVFLGENGVVIFSRPLLQIFRYRRYIASWLKTNGIWFLKMWDFKKRLHNWVLWSLIGGLFISCAQSACSPTSNHAGSDAFTHHFSTSCWG